MSTINMTTIETSVDALIGVVLEHRPRFSARDQVVLKAAILASPEPEALMADLRRAYVKKALGRAIDRILNKDYYLPKPEPKPKPASTPEPTAKPAPEPTPVEDSYEDDDGWDEDFFRDIVKGAVGDGEKVFGRKLTHDEAGRLAEAVSEMGDWAQDPSKGRLLSIRLRSHFHRLTAKFRVRRGGRVKMDLWMNPRSVKSVAKYFAKAKIAANPETLVRAVMEGWISEEEVMYKTTMRHREWFVENFGTQPVVA